jgi:DnaK suppressor protein
MIDRKEELLALKHELSTRIAQIEKHLHSQVISHALSEQALERQNDDVLLNLRVEAEQ